MRSQKLQRCPWADPDKPDYLAYHDTEWGAPVTDDRVMFEYLILESAQAGLSWYTVLKKREEYRRAFRNFDPGIVARYDRRKIELLLSDPGIIRNRMKIEAAVNNARRFLEIQSESGSFTKYVWRFVDGRPMVHSFRKLSDYPATTPESDGLSRDLKQRGFKFLGPTICYSFLQATGLVNDHAIGCFRREEIIGTYRRMRI